MKEVEDKMHPPKRKMIIDIDAAKSIKEYPQRPGFGTHGKEIDLTANYFQVTPPRNLNLYRYNVKITPDVKARKEF